VADHGRCGEKIESIFSAPLSFFFFFLSVGDWRTAFLMGVSPPRIPGRVVSSLGEKSDSLGEVIDIADCLDFRDGEALVAEDWFKAELEAAALDNPIELELFRVCLLVPLAREE